MWKFLLKAAIVVGIIGGIGALAWPSIAKAIAERNKPRWRTASVEKGTITKFVNATGGVRPVKSVQVGSFVSGPIQELYVEFNQEVKQGELLAKIDPRLFASVVARDQATLETRKADVLRVKALLQQAINDEARAKALQKQNPDFIAQSEMDQFRFNRMALEAQLVIAEASVQQASASLVNSQANLDYCEIRSPEDGMIIDRKVEPGQTLAAQFQTPELFVVGVGMRDKMHIFADVDESEIGMIREAAKREMPVTFTVDAYPQDLFKGKIEEVRFSSNTTQNVVTYPVVVAAANPDLKLLPGMTANLSFKVQETEGDVIKIPKSALRFYPPDIKYVHPDDRRILEGDWGDTDSDSDEGPAIQVRTAGGPGSQASETDEVDESTADERIEMRRREQKRHVWTFDGEYLRAHEVRIGINGNRFAEMLEGDLTEDTVLVTGQKAAGEK